MILRAEAFAKVNRELRVLGKREDGYHDLDTVFQAIDLSDTLEVSDDPELFSLVCDRPDVPADQSNLVWRAAADLARASGVKLRGRVSLTKRIPAGAGLGGGSSDAAVAILLLARLWGLPTGPGALRAIGARVGSDVPFFFVGGTARGQGRGERITPLPDGPPRRLLLIVPPFPISTAGVYRMWEPPVAPDTPGNYFGRNDLAEAVLKYEPEMRRYWEATRDRWPDSIISGSGSVLAAVLRDDESITESLLSRTFPGARFIETRTVGCSEYAHRTTLDLAKEAAS